MKKLLIFLLVFLILVIVGCEEIETTSEEGSKEGATLESKPHELDEITKETNKNLINKDGISVELLGVFKCNDTNALDRSKQVEKVCVSLTAKSEEGFEDGSFQAMLYDKNKKRFYGDISISKGMDLTDYKYKNLGFGGKYKIEVLESQSFYLIGYLSGQEGTSFITLTIDGCEVADEDFYEGGIHSINGLLNWDCDIDAIIKMKGVFVFEINTKDIKLDGLN